MGAGSKQMNKVATVVLFTAVEIIISTNPFNFEICVKYNQSSQRRIETCIDFHDKESMLQIYMESFTQLTINHSSSQSFNTHYLCCVWQFVPLSRLIDMPSKCLSKLFISWSLSANVAAVS